MSIFPIRLAQAVSFFLLSSIVSATAGTVSYQFFRFTPTKLRNGSANSVQLAEVQMFLGASQVTGAVATNPGGNNPGGEGPVNAADGLLSSKWLDFNKGALVLNFGSQVSIDGYRWGTANDSIERDPIRWTLEGSNNNVTWTLLDDRTAADQSVTTTRQVYLATSDLNQAPDTPVIDFTISAGGVTSSTAVGVAPGGQVSLAWDVDGSTSRTLDLGSGPVAVGATGATNDIPAATQDYILSATNASGTVSKTVTAFVGSSVIPPVINEIMADPTRDGVLCDEDGDASDWIELANANGFALDVGGYFLTDDPAGITKWQIPAGTSIGPSDFLVIFASSKNRAVAGAELHTSFNISSGGEYLALLNPDGSTVVDEFAPTFPAQSTDVSYGRVPPVTGSAFDYFVAPTPGFENDTSPGPPGEEVVFVTPAQTFTGSMQVTLSAVSGTAQIRYTVDGTIPDASSTLYSGPITISDSTLVRARVYDAGFAPGEVKAEAYIEISSAVANQTSDLPIIVLENFGAGTVPNGASLQASYLTLFEPDALSGRTDLTALPTKANRAGIKRRGSSTLNDPKGNYRVELWRDDSEEDKELNLLGMSKHDEWILFAPYNFDRALVRNSFIHEISNDIGTYAPRTRFCEVYLNTGGTVGTSDYQGVYVLMERISRDPDRIDIDRLDKNDTAVPDVSGGYVLSIDRLDGGDAGFRSALGHPEDPAIAGPQPWFTFVYPKEQNILPQQSAYIRGYVDDLESALYGPNFKDPDVGYAAWLDVDASIDHHILNTFTKDPDALRLSTYLYKPRDGKLGFGPIWDFDRTMGCDSDSRSSNPIGWDPPNETAQFFLYDYWGRLFQDENFWQKWIDRWQSLRDGQFSDANLIGRVDGLAAEITESQPRNAAKWPQVSPNGGPLTALGGWPGEVDHLKNWLTQRANWIDTQFTTRPILQASGQVNSGDVATAVPPEGTLYYSTDGTDPRLPGGGINPSAIAITGGGGTVDTTLVSEAGTGIEVLVPDSASPGATAWTVESFNSAGWQTGNFAVGYDYAGVSIDVENPSGGEPTSVYVRAPFTVANPASFTGMTLRVKYDDGFVAYLNGNVIETANAPATIAWNSAATANHDDAQAVNFIDFDVTDDLGSLLSGNNVLAIHALNAGTANATNTGSGSSDMLMSAELIASAPPGGSGITVNATTSVIARSLAGGDWSGPVAETYIIGDPATAANLVVSEIMYHPLDATAAEASAGFTVASDFEFLEVQNISGATIDLTGVIISGAFDFTFTGSSVVNLAPGEVAVVVRNISAFEVRYGTGLPIAGQWGDPATPDGGQKLSNGGELVTITGVGATTIRNFSYDDSVGWPQQPDGGGPALVLVDPFSVPDHSLPVSWRESIAAQGTPGVSHIDLCAEWAADYFTAAELSDVEISGEGADPDGDGLSNLIELALASDPKISSPAAIPTAAVQNLGGIEYLTLSFTRRTGLSGLNIDTQFSSDLALWPSTGVLVSSITNVDGSETVTYRDTEPRSDRRFVRLRVTK